MYELIMPFFVVPYNFNNNIIIQESEICCGRNGENIYTP